MLHAPTNRRERILNYGPWNGGKTTNWIKIAQWLARTNSPAKVHVLDSDNTWEASNPGDCPNVRAYSVYDIPEWKAAAKKIHAEVDANKGRGDWIVIDMADKLWSASQRHFFLEAYGKDLDDFFIEIKRVGGTVGGEYGTNWQAINTTYVSIFNPIVFRSPAHVFVATPADQMRIANEKTGKGGEDPLIQSLFKEIGYKPQGQKDLAHAFHTVLYSVESPSGWRVTSAKDRNRERMKGVKMQDFVVDYLIKIGGWRP